MLLLIYRTLVGKHITDFIPSHRTLDVQFIHLLNCVVKTGHGSRDVFDHSEDKRELREGISVYLYGQRPFLVVYRISHKVIEMETCISRFLKLGVGIPKRVAVFSRMI
jgi:hypothetical protein